MSDKLCFVQKSAERSPDALALKFQDSNLTYKQLDSMICSAMRWLESLGLKKGERLALLGENSPEWVAVAFGALRLGASIVPLNPRFKLRDWERAVSISNCKLIVSEEPEFKKLRRALFSDFKFFLETDADEAGETDSQISSDAECAVLFTSGSSGEAKGVVLPYASFSIGAKESNERTGFSKDDTWLLSLSLAHVGGLSILFRVFEQGGAVLIPAAQATSDIAKMIQGSEISFVSLVPSMLLDIAAIVSAEVLANLACIVLGGAPVTREVSDLAERVNTKIMNSYGMTETAAHISTSSGAVSDLLSVGSSLGSTSIEIEDGKVLLSGPRLFTGYLKSDRSFEVAPERFVTGDIGFIDRGSLTITGRADRMFFSGGENIQPAEIEQVAVKIGGVKHAAVIGVPSKRWGKRPVLFIESENEELKESDVLKQIKVMLGSIKTPEEVYFERLPRTTIGKVHYEELEKLYANRNR